MRTVYTCGIWQASAGSEEAFVEAWLEFAEWASAMPGAGTLRLVRDLAQPERFQSFGDWESIAEVRGWKSSPEFRERMGRVQQHVADFTPSELELVASAQGGASAREALVEAG
jgi:heme-degrading monooxygenase HmoA